MEVEFDVRTPTELKRIDDGGNFDRLQKEAMELSKGNDLLGDQILVQRVVVELWNNSVKKGPSLAQEDHIVLPPACRKPRTLMKRFRPKKERQGNRDNDKKKRERKKPRIYTDEEKEQLEQRGLSLELSEEVRAKLRELGGLTDPVRVIIKHLTYTDLSSSHGRFNLPKGQLLKPEKGGGFLTGPEWKALEKEETMQVRVVGPRCTEPNSMVLKSWKQSSGSVPILCKGWAQFLIKYEMEHPGILNQEDGVQLWLTRCNEGRDLLLALQVIQPPAVDVGGEDHHE